MNAKRSTGSLELSAENADILIFYVVVPRLFFDHMLLA